MSLTLLSFLLQELLCSFLSFSLRLPSSGLPSSCLSSSFHIWSYLHHSGVYLSLHWPVRYWAQDSASWPYESCFLLAKFFSLPTFQGFSSQNHSIWLYRILASPFSHLHFSHLFSTVCRVFPLGCAYPNFIEKTTSVNLSWPTSAFCLYTCLTTRPVSVHTRKISSGCPHP